MALGGKFQGGYDKGAKPAPKTGSINGKGTIPFKKAGGKHDQKDIIGGGHPPMSGGVGGIFGRVLYPTKRKGMAEGNPVKK